MRLIAGALVCAMVAGQAGAATFYYVGGLYDFANYAGATTPPGFATAVLDIDDAQFPEGVAGQSYTFDLDWESETFDLAPTGISMNFTNGWPIEINTGNPDRNFAYQGSTISFDAAGRPKDWDFHTIFEEGASFWGRDGVGSDGTFSNLGEVPWEDIATEFLVDRGYKPGTKKFNEQRDSHTWLMGHGYGEGGRWYSDALEFAAAVGRQTLAALSHIPSNIYRIPNCRVASSALTAEDFAPPAA